MPPTCAKDQILGIKALAAQFGVEVGAASGEAARLETAARRDEQLDEADLVSMLTIARSFCRPPAGRPR
ncbi:MAG: hypothetical protein HC788_15720 [Sphingopyxis sp.]|nr:hypothetical protein [Sphingopyxis sp.]